MAITIDETRLQVLEVVTTFKCMSQYADMLLFFSNSENNQAIYDAVKKYGMPLKSETREITHGGTKNIYGDWIVKPQTYTIGICSSLEGGMYRCYLASQLYSKYPKFDFKDVKNCEKSKNLKIALDEEKVYIDNQHIADRDDTKYTYSLSIINDYMSELNGAIATLNCNKVIDQQQQQQQLDIIDKTANTGTSETKESKVGTYVMYSIVFLIAAIVIKKTIFNN